MSKRIYPLVLIDRTKDKAHPYIFVRVEDDEVGFTARLLEFYNQAEYDLFRNTMSGKTHGDVLSVCYKFPRKEGGVALEIVKRKEGLEMNAKQCKRIHSLMKRAIKKILFGEVERTPSDANLGIEEQIKQQNLTVERAKANYDELLDRAQGDRTLADYQIALAEATLETLKKYRDNINFIELN